MLAETSKILTILTVFVFSIFAIYLLTHNRERRLSNFLLAAFLLAQAFDIFENIIISDSIRQSNFSVHTRMWGFPFFFLYLPLLYLYVRSVIDSEFKLKVSHTIHAIPFCIILMYLIFNFYIHSTETNAMILMENRSFKGGIFDWNLLLLYHNFQFLAYIIASFGHLAKYRHKIKAYTSSIDAIKLSWLNWVLILFVIVKIFDLITHLLMILNARALLPPYILFRETGFLLFAVVIVIKNIRQPQIHFNPDLNTINPKYKTAPLTSTAIQSYLAHIEQTMQQNKLYLNPEFNLSDLSKATSIPRQYISQALNESIKKNFFDFVNHHRIEEAKRIFQNPQTSSRTVLEVCFQVGFNTQSTFNRIFKKETSMTPTEFRKLYHPE